VYSVLKQKGFSRLVFQKGK